MPPNNPSASQLRVLIITCATVIFRSFQTVRDIPGTVRRQPWDMAGIVTKIVPMLGTMFMTKDGIVTVIVPEFIQFFSHNFLALIKDRIQHFLYNSFKIYFFAEKFYRSAQNLYKNVES